MDADPPTDDRAGADRPAAPPVLLVVGGTGYLGRHVAAHAARQGWEVVATGFTQGSTRLDLRDRAAVAAAVDAARPAAVVNCAYLQHGDDARSVNVDGAAHLAGEARAAGARLVHLSTDVVFDGRAGRPYTEADRPCPLSDYGSTKADAEEAVAAAHPAAVLVRTSLIYGGPGGEESGHERTARDPDATFFDDELRSPVQVDDLAEAVVELCGAHAGLSGPLHVAGGTDVSRRAFAALASGRPVAEVRGAPAPDHRPKDCRLDSSRARTVLVTALRGVDEVFAAGAASPAAGAGA